MRLKAKGTLSYHPLSFVFVYFSIIMSVSWLYTLIFSPENSLVIFQIINDDIPFPWDIAWGVGIMTAGLGVLIYYWTAIDKIALWSSVLGLILWLFMGAMYILESYPEGMLVAALPNIAFWFWFAVYSRRDILIRHDSENRYCQLKGDTTGG